MKNTLSPRLVSFANKVAKIPFAKSLLKPFYYAYKKKLARKRNEAYNRHALDTLAVFDECMKQNGVEYTLFFGTMLGAIRERGFIKHDVDIDVAVWKEDYSPKIQRILEENGFKLDHRFLIDEGESAREETYVRNDVSIDVYCIFPPIDTYPYVCSKWMPIGECVTLEDSMEKYGYVTGKRLEMPIIKRTVRTQFESLSLPILENSEEVLSFYYGADYMNPNPEWRESTDYPFRKAWPDKKAFYFKY